MLIQITRLTEIRRRQVLIATLVASIAAAGVLLRSGPSWKTELDAPIASTASLNAHRVKFKRDDRSFEAVIARMPRNGAKAKLVDPADGKSLTNVAHDAAALLAWPLLGGPALDRALNLDGGPSSGFVLDAMGSQTQRLPRGRIRNAILFLPTN